MEVRDTQPSNGPCFLDTRKLWLIRINNYAVPTYRLMHVALINVPAYTIMVLVEASIAYTLVSRLQVLASAMWTDSRDHGTFVDVYSTVILARTFGTEDLVVFAAVCGTRFARYSPA